MLIAKDRAVLGENGGIVLIWFFYAVLASLWKFLCKVLAHMCLKTSDIERTSACSLSAEALGDRV